MKTHFASIAGFCVILTLSACIMHGGEISSGGISAALSPDGTRILVKTGDEELFFLYPMLRSGTTLSSPDEFNATFKHDTVVAWGSFENAVFSGSVHTGNGITFYFRFYPKDAKNTSEPLICIEGKAVEKLSSGKVIHDLGDVRLVCNSVFTSGKKGQAFIKKSDIHITAPPAGFISFSITPGKVRLPALSGKLELTGAIKQHYPVHLQFSVIDSIPNPYLYKAVTFELTSPSGKKKIIEPFFFQDFQEDGDRYNEKDIPSFKVLFSPEEAGDYTWALKTEERVLSRGKFRSDKTDSKGFIRTRKDSRYFYFSSGDIFFPVGLNVCWADDYKKHMDVMAENGIDLMRVWLCTWGFDAEGTYVNDFRMDTCYELDRLFEYAREKGIYIMLCLNNFHDFRYNRNLHEGYFGADGLCENAQEFFTLKKCLDARKNFIRYLIGRYGGYTFLFAWELWNEVDYAISPDDVDIPAAENEMALFIKSVDPYGRPVTTSLGVWRVDHDLWKLDSMDIIQYHAYIPEYNLIMRGSEYGDAAALIRERKKSEFNDYKKPVLLSEFGYNGTNESNPNNDIDPDGVMLHNSLWASTLSGWSGTAMHWWWDYYIEKNNLFYLYKPVATVLSEFRFSEKTLPFGTDSIYKNRVRVMGLKDRTYCLLWVQDKMATWEYMKVRSYVPKTFAGVRIRIGKFDKGTYRVTWYNTFTGKETGFNKVEITDGFLELSVPEFTRDTACVVMPFENK